METLAGSYSTKKAVANIYMRKHLRQKLVLIKVAAIGPQTEWQDQIINSGKSLEEPSLEAVVNNQTRI